MSARSSISRRNRLERAFYPDYVKALSWYIEWWNATEGWNTTGAAGPMIRKEWCGTFTKFNRSAALMNLGEAMGVVRGFQKKDPDTLRRLRNHCTGQIIMVA